MDLETHLQVWKELKPHLMGGDVEAAAEDFIRVLIEHGAEAESIAEYALDEALKLALQEYIELDEETFDDDHDETEYED